MRTLLLLLAGCAAPAPPGVLIDGCRLLTWGPPARCEGAAITLLGDIAPAPGCTFEPVADHAHRVTPGPEGCSVVVGVDRSVTLRLMPVAPPCDAASPCVGDEGGARCAMARASAARSGAPAPEGCTTWPSLPADAPPDAWLAAAEEAAARAGWARQAQKLHLIRANEALLQRRSADLGATLPDPADAELTLLRRRTEGQQALLQRQYLAALAHFDAALDLAVRLGPSDRLTATIDRKAQALARLGRIAEAKALYEPNEAASPCARAILENNLAWIEVLEIHQGLRPPAEASSILTRAAAAKALLDASTTSCPPLGDLTLHEAFAHLWLDDLAAARAALDQALRLAQAHETSRWARVLTAELAARSGDLAAADAAWTALEGEATEDRDLEFLWRAGSARAALAWRRGDGDAARAHLARADAAFNGLAETLSLADRLEAFLSLDVRPIGSEVSRLARERDLAGALAASRAHRRRLAARYWAPAELARADADVVGLLEERRRAVDALAGAPAQARAQALTQIAALDHRLEALTLRAAERLGTSDTSRAPEPDEVIVHVAPWDRGGEVAWAPIVVTSDGTRLGAPFPAAGDHVAAFAASLRPLAETLHGRSRLTLILPAFLDAADVAWADVGFGPLLHHMTVAWSADLRPTVGRAPPASLALVMNPSGDPALRGASDHGRTIAAGWGGALAAVDPRAAESALGMRSLLERPTLDGVHIVSHARLDRDPLRAALRLQGGPFTARDVMTSTRVPRTVTLAACQSTAEAGLIGGMGLATAFVFAGSDVVIGSSRDVNSEVAYAFYEALYAAWQASGDARAAFRAAAIEVERRFPGEDTHTFRLLLAGG